MNASGSQAPAPDWMHALMASLDGVTAEDLVEVRIPQVGPGRPGAVLILLGQDSTGPDVLLIERAADMRSHAGQPAFPGGAVDPEDSDATAAALREAQEETGLDPSGVTVMRTLPEIWLPPSGFTVTPVLAWWHRPVPVGAQDPREVARAMRVPIADLVDPGNRVTVVHPLGFRGPGFQVVDMLVWGFTGMILDRLLDLGGWARPWPVTREVRISL